MKASPRGGELADQVALAATREPAGPTVARVHQRREPRDEHALTVVPGDFRHVEHER